MTIASPQSQIAALPASQLPEITFAEIEGRRLRVLRWHGGAAGAPPLLFFTGIGSNAEILAPFLERLAGREVITFDLPGIGGSATSGGPYRLPAMARIAAALLARRGIERVDVMGTSWGGMLAQQFAHAFAPRTRRLILAGTTPGVVMVPGRLSALAMMVNIRRFKDPVFLRRNFGVLYGGGNDGWELYAAGVEEPTTRGYLYQLGALAGWTSLDFLHGIAARTLVLGGGDDSLVRPINLRVLHALLPDSELQLIEGAGHMFLLSHLEDAADRVERFHQRV
jgi:poly(3-hydroxyalkanoate) depolymerase